MNRKLMIATLSFLVSILVLATSLGLHRKPRYIQNFEITEYAESQQDIEMHSIVDGLAIYTNGSGEPVLLFPYPHSHTEVPMVQEPLSEVLVDIGRSVATFDVPGAYRSTRLPVGDMDEMIKSADETLLRSGIDEPVDVIGHSMGGLAALAYAIERPERTKRLVLVTSLSGFPAAARWGLPGSAFHFTELDYWRIILWGMRLNAGRGNLAMHKRLQNLMEYTSFHKKEYFIPEEITLDDYKQGVPIRTIWSKNMYGRLSYTDRLDEVQSSTLILAGRYDPEAPLQCSEELQQGIPDASLMVFEHSGHFPFIEESMLFKKIVKEFLNH